MNENYEVVPWEAMMRDRTPRKYSLRVAGGTVFPVVQHGSESEPFARIKNPVTNREYEFTEGDLKFLGVTVYSERQA